MRRLWRWMNERCPYCKGRRFIQHEPRSSLLAVGDVRRLVSA